MDRLSRRSILSMLGVPAANLLARQAPQGMASRNVHPAPRAGFSGKPFDARFTDIGQRAGLRCPVICGHSDHVDYIVETMSCGAAFLDFDNDGWIDILVLSGSRFGDPPPDASNRLYRNNRDGTFTDVTHEAGLFRTGYAYGITVGDYNNDGWEDIFITYWGENVLYRNNGDGTFTDVTESAGLKNAKPRFGSGCTFLDYDLDGKLDLFVANYVDFDIATVPRAGAAGSCNYEGVLVNCGPRGLPYGVHSLYRNNGDGTFSDVTQASGISKTPGGYGLTAVAADLDNDGWPDIYVACDSTPSLLFRNNHDGTFSEKGLEMGVALSEDGMEQSGMGVGIGDVRLTGRLDIVKTHFSHDTPVLYVRERPSFFDDMTLQSGLGVETRYVSWGVGIFDLDNDGNPDIFWVTGGIYPEAEKKLSDSPMKSPRILFRNLGGGRFEELGRMAGAAIESPHCSRGCAFGDFDNDGDLDILIVNQNEPPSLLRNDVSGGNHWIKVKLRGERSNRSAIGARVTASYGGKIQSQEVLAQSSYLSVNDSRLHFGIGLSKKVDLEIRWPAGGVEKLTNIPADQLVHITEGRGIVHSQRFR